jgi:hypothetical protein
MDNAETPTILTHEYKQNNAETLATLTHEYKQNNADTGNIDTRIQTK